MQQEVSDAFGILELKVLKHIVFELEIDVPHKYLRIFRDRFFFNEQDSLVRVVGDSESLGVQITELVNLAKPLIMHQYLTPLCLYFPAPIITAASFLIADRLYTRKGASSLLDIP